jgi:hypothetical protein
MSHCNKLTYHNVNGEAFERLRKELERRNLVIGHTTAGRLEGQGLRAEFQFDPGRSTLTVEFLAHPPLTSPAQLGAWVHERLMGA